MSSRSPSPTSAAPATSASSRTARSRACPRRLPRGWEVVWARCTAPGRHVSFEAGVREAVVCWTAPRPYDEACDAFLDRALSVHFKGAMPRFTHDAAAVMPQSKVVQKLRQTQARLPASFWFTESAVTRQDQVGLTWELERLNRNRAARLLGLAGRAPACSRASRAQHATRVTSRHDTGRRRRPTSSPTTNSSPLSRRGPRLIADLGVTDEPAELITA